MRLRLIPLAVALAVGAVACGPATAPGEGIERSASASPTTTTTTPSTPSTTTPSTTTPSTTTPSTTTPPTSTTTAAPSADRPVTEGEGGRPSGARLGTDGTPTFPGDFADPFLLRAGDTYYAYATNAFFTNVPVLVAGEAGNGLGEDALPELPAWSEPGHVWAPSVTAVGDSYVLHYTTRHSASGRQCISVATATDPAGPFVDESTEPLICPLELGGAIDPSTVQDGDDLWLLWKSDGNCCAMPTRIFAQPLTADGEDLAGDPVELIRNDLWWERDVVEAPSMIEHDGQFHLFYSANRWDTEDYAVGHAVCETVAGPCVKDPEPWLADTDATSGPGGLEVMVLEDRPVDLVVYHGWTGDEVGYDTGRRSLYVRPIRWPGGVPTSAG